MGNAVKFAAAILTRNIYDNERRDLFEQTVDSLKAADVELYVIDNGSTDGTKDLVRHWGYGFGGYPQYSDDLPPLWTPHISTNANTTSGFGTWLSCRRLAATDADICICSDDDMEWKPGFTNILEDWWAHAPDKLTLTGGHLEPEYFWNDILAHPVYGNTHGLLRASTGAASWTFPRAHYDRLALVAARLPITLQGHWDVPVCRGLRERDWLIGQLDLAEHVGQGRSTWGNRSEPLYGWDTEPVRAQL